MPNLTKEITKVFRNKCYHLIILGYKKQIKQGDYDTSWDENDLTQQLVKKMKLINRKNTVRGPFKINWDTKDTSSVSMKKSKEADTVGYIDILIDRVKSKGPVSFSVESKILDKKSRHLRYYIGDGIVRFVIGKYAADDDYAAMVGYVVGDNLDDILKALKSRISNSQEAKTKSSLSFVDTINDVETYVSEHKRNNSLGPIKLRHLFLDYTVT